MSIISSKTSRILWTAAESCKARAIGQGDSLFADLAKVMSSLSKDLGSALTAGAYDVELAEDEEITLRVLDSDGCSRTVVVDREGVRATAAGDEDDPDPKKLTYR